MTWRRGCRQEYGFNVKFFYISDLQFPLIYDGNDRTYITGPLRWPGLTSWQGQCNGIGVQGISSRGKGFAANTQD